MSDTRNQFRTVATPSLSSPSTAISIRKRIRTDDLDFVQGSAGNSSHHYRDLNPSRNRPPEKMSMPLSIRYPASDPGDLEDPEFEADTDGDAEMDPGTAVHELICSSSSSNESTTLSMRRLEKTPARTSPTSSKALTYAETLKGTSQDQVKRDEAYYFEDGSCVLLVGDTLFNVHRSILSRDSSSFSTLFSLPQGIHMTEGRSDDNPIVLLGDSPDEFRHFLWALYALPPELSVANSPHANLPQLISIARVANKYAFKSLEMWALDAIHDFVNRKPSPILRPPSLPPSSLTTNPGPSDTTPPVTPTQGEISILLTQLIRLAQLCSHERLMSSMISLLRQLMSSNVHYAYLAMTLSDELDLRALRGQAYLEVMRRGVVVQKIRGENVGTSPGLTEQRNSSSSSLLHMPREDEDRNGDDGNRRLLITRAQQLRLLAGYYRLTSLWDRLRLTPLAFEHSHSCGATWHQQGCTQSWLEFWKEKTRSDSVMGLGLADVLGRLKMVQKDYERWGSATYMHHDCRALAKKAIGDVIAKIEDGLPDYFAEPGEFEDD